MIDNILNKAGRQFTVYYDMCKKVRKPMPQKNLRRRLRNDVKRGRAKR